MIRATCLLLLLISSFPTHASELILPTVSIEHAAINGVLIEQDGKYLAIYGANVSNKKNCEQVLLTHHRRDVLWKARHMIETGTKAVAPADERDLIENPSLFWNAFVKDRFHDYSQKTTKVLAHPLPVNRWVKDGDVVSWRGIDFEVVETPGYTEGAVSYIADIDGKKLAFSGDLIYGDGQLCDLYSFQDVIVEANLRGYHGYGSRLAQLLSSLEKLLAKDPDWIIPARGPVIKHPKEAIEKLSERVRSLYRNFLSTTAMYWYYKEDRMRLCGERILGKGAPIDLMPFSHHEKTPDWIFEHATSRLLVSEDGYGFLLDCGYQQVIDAVKEHIHSGRIKKLEGIFTTHYHDDHTDLIQDAAEEFGCPVYATTEYADILENPGAYHMPALTTSPIRYLKPLSSGETIHWHEFELTAYFFPGQTIYHGALLARRKNERPVFFIGDSFSPTGIDDYCVMNRNLLHKEGGYRLCLDKLRNMKERPWLVNEHVQYVFEFSDAELDTLIQRFEERVAILEDLFPWDAPNYGIDEQWAVFYPYGLATKSGKNIELQVRITNHSPVRREFQVVPRLPSDMKLLQSESRLTLEPGQTGAVRMKVAVTAASGNYLITADIHSEGMDFRDWIEALVTVE